MGSMICANQLAIWERQKGDSETSRQKLLKFSVRTPSPIIYSIVNKDLTGKEIVIPSSNDATTQQHILLSLPSRPIAHSPSISRRDAEPQFSKKVPFSGFRGHAKTQSRIVICDNLCAICGICGKKNGDGVTQGQGTRGPSAVPQRTFASLPLLCCELGFS